MPVACLLDLKERTESKDEGARGSAANEVRRKTKSPHPDQVCICKTLGTVKITRGNMPVATITLSSFKII
ncbi:MAG: hypothetical protein WA120_01700 [Candidatus Hydromicrobium sp.]